MDLIRGVAVLGVLLANLVHFCVPNLRAWSQLSPADRVVAAVIRLSVDAKFITMLAILFGAGLAIQHDRALQHGRPFVAPYLWRQLLLFLLGLAHVVFLWFGDILATYALVSVFVLLVVRLGPAWEKGVMTFGLAWIYAVLLVIFVVVLILTLLGVPLGEHQPIPDPSVVEGPPLPLWKDTSRYFEPDNQIRIYRTGSFSDQVINRLIFFAIGLLMIPPFLGWYLAACFLIGVQLVRLGAFEPHTRPRWLFNDFVTLGLWVGIPLHVVSAIWGLCMPSSWLPGIVQFAGALPQALLYLALLVWWNESHLLSGLQARFRAVGRMALTNYLMQSVLCVLFFNNIGLNYYGTTGLLGGLPLVAAIWALELLWSPLWLSVFHLGPIEWLWRSLAAFRPMPIFKRKEMPT
ncbi:MAG: DUF418 domain-containing protein [Gemmataceae bacterium]